MTGNNSKQKESFLASFLPPCKTIKDEAGSHTRLFKKWTHELTLPSAMMEVLTKRDVFVGVPFVQKSLRPLIGSAMINAPSEEAWKFSHDAYMPHFLRAAIREKTAPIIVEECLNMIDRWKKSPTYLNVEPEMLRMTGRVITRKIFGDEIANKYGTEIIDLFSSALRKASEPNIADKIIKRLNIPFNHAAFIPSVLLWSLGITDSYTAKIPAHITAALGKTNPILDKIIELRWNLTEQTNDVLGSLLTARRPNGSRFTPEEIKKEIAMLVATGHETTATALAWSIQKMTELSEKFKRMPDETFDWLGQIRAEFNAVSNNGELHGKEYADLKISITIFDEACRLYSPVASSARYALSDYNGKHFKAKKGDIIDVNFKKMMIREDLWDAPLTYSPERFLKPLKDPGAFMPFGAGSHKCLGMDMAKAEGALVIALIAQHLDLKILRAFDGQEQFFTVRPKGELWIQAKERRQDTSFPEYISPAVLETATSNGCPYTAFKNRLGL